MKKIFLLPAAVALFSASSFQAFAGTWRQGAAPNEALWWYDYDNGSYASNGWYWIDGNNDSVAECYYFDPSGWMLAGTTTPDGYSVDASGAWTSNGVVQTRYQAAGTAQGQAQDQSQGRSQAQNQAQGQNQIIAQDGLPSGQGQDQSQGSSQNLSTGWQEDATGWRYYLNNRFLTSEWRKIGGKRYYFDESSYMVTGFTEIDGEYYYFESSGALKEKTFYLDGTYYVLDEDDHYIIEEVDESDWSEYRRDNDISRKDVDSSASGNNFYSGGSEVDEADFAYQVYEIVNEERSKKNRDELEWDEDLAACAQERAEEIVEKFSHTRPDGSSCFTILKENDISYRSAGENIAYGQSDPEDVMNSWMNSSGHRANILNSNFERIGVGCYQDGYTLYWVQLFTK